MNASIYGCDDSLVVAVHLLEPQPDLRGAHFISSRLEGPIDGGIVVARYYLREGGFAETRMRQRVEIDLEQLAA